MMRRSFKHFERDLMRCRKLVGWVALTGLLTLQNAWADCSLPPAPSRVPEAATATDAEMLSAMQTLKRYNSDVTNYCKCLDFEARQGRIRSTEQERLQTAAIEGLQSIAEKFNEQVRLFKANASR